MDVNRVFAQNIRVLRLAQELSQEALADKSGLHRTYIGAVERGERNITLFNANRIAEALGINLSDCLLEPEPIIDQSQLDTLLQQYAQSFTEKAYDIENNNTDLLMDVFGITPDLKRENRQYWGRELGMCWERLIVELCRQTCNDFSPALQVNADQLCDLIVGQQAIDIKYRIGSGDSGTLKKWKTYARRLQEKDYEPILLIMREDNLSAAISACTSSGWTIYTGESTFEYITQLTGFDIKNYLTAKAFAYKIDRH